MVQFVVHMAGVKEGPSDRLLELKGTMDQTYATLFALKDAGIIEGWFRNPTRITGEPNPFDEEVA